MLLYHPEIQIRRKVTHLPWILDKTPTERTIKVVNSSFSIGPHSVKWTQATTDQLTSCRPVRQAHPLMTPRGMRRVTLLQSRRSHKSQRLRSICNRYLDSINQWWMHQICSESPQMGLRAWHQGRDTTIFSKLNMLKVWSFLPKSSPLKMPAVRLHRDPCCRTPWEPIMACQTKPQGRSTSQSISCLKCGILMGTFRWCSSLGAPPPHQVWWRTVFRSPIRQTWHLAKAVIRMKRFLPLNWIQTTNCKKLKKWIHLSLASVTTTSEGELFLLKLWQRFEL